MPTSGPLVDAFGRRHTYVRVSVTDRCNLRCVYCMPAEGFAPMPHNTLLSYEETARLVAVFAGMGIKRIRFTGGEPLVRRDLPELVQAVSAIEGIDDIAMTTNAYLLRRNAEALKQAGLTRVNVSLDSLDATQFSTLTRGGDVARVVDGVHAALEAGLTPVKINAVIMAGVNDNQLDALVDYFAPYAGQVVVRFIEYMPFGERTRRQHLPSGDMRKELSKRFTVENRGRGAGGPATQWVLAENGLEVGFISPITEHFCETCNRLRLSASGDMRTCLSRENNPSLRDLMRQGASDQHLEQVLRGIVWGKPAGHEAHLGDDDFKPFEGIMTRIGG